MANRTFFNDWEGDNSSMNVTPSHDNNNDVTFNDQNAIGAAQMPIQNIPLPPDHHGLAPGASGPTWVQAQQFYAKKSQPPLQSQAPEPEDECESPCECCDPDDSSDPNAELNALCPQYNTPKQSLQTPKASEMTFFDAGIDVGQYDVGRKDNHPRTVRLRDGAAHPVTPGPARSAVATHQKRHSKNIKMCMAPNPNEGELELQLNPSELTFFDDAMAGPSSSEIECQRPRTPFPTPEQASGVGAKRKLLTNNGGEQKDPPKRTRLSRTDESMNTSTDIDAMIRTKRSEMERADAVHQEKIRTLVSLIPIVCDSGNRYPEPVVSASLTSMTEMLTNHQPSLVEELLRNKPNILRHLDDLSYRNQTKEEVVKAVFQIVSVIASGCIRVLLSSGDNDKYFKSLLKRFLKSEFKEVAANAKELIESCKTRV